MHLGRGFPGDHVLVSVVIGPAQEEDPSDLNVLGLHRRHSQLQSALAVTRDTRMRPHPEDHTKSGLAPRVVIKPRQRLPTAENFGRWHPRYRRHRRRRPGIGLEVHIDVVQGPFGTTAPLSAQAVFAILVESAVLWVDEVGTATVRDRTYPAARTCE